MDTTTGAELEPVISTGDFMEDDRDAEKEPGYAWKNAKAREEYQRAMESVVDKNFSLRMHYIVIGFSWCC